MNTQTMSTQHLPVETTAMRAACTADRSWTFINATYGHQRPSGAPPS